MNRSGAENAKYRTEGIGGRGIRPARSDLRVLAPWRLGVSFGGCRGFSLVEMVVVIGIVALLAGILLPTLSSARRRARRTQCVNNLKQLAKAHQIYQTDYPDGMFCQATSQVFPGQQGQKYERRPLWVGDWSGLWMGGMETYGGNVEMYQCPEADERNVNTFDVPHLRKPVVVGYGWGALFYRNPKKRWKEVQAHPADHPLFMDQQFYKFYYLEKGINYLRMVSFANAPAYWLREGYKPSRKDRRHPAGSNVVFYDGHVETLDVHGVWKRLNYYKAPMPKYLYGG